MISPRRWSRFGIIATILLAGTYLVRANFNADDSNIANATIDLGVVCSDAAKSVAWYKDALGFQELSSFDAPADFVTDIGLVNKLPLHVQVLSLGDGTNGTKLKLMEFKSAPGARVDNAYLNSSYGFRYLTIFVKDLNKSLARAEKAGAKPIAKNPQPLPAGFPEGLGIAVFRDPDGNFVELVGPWKKS